MLGRIYIKPKTTKKNPLKKSFTQTKNEIIDDKSLTELNEIVEKMGEYFYWTSSNSSLDPMFLNYKINPETNHTSI